jgi:hypothetical protein
LGFLANVDTQGAQACHPSSNLQKNASKLIGAKWGKYCFVLFLHTIQPRIKLGICRLTQLMRKPLNPLKDHLFLLDEHGNE